MAPTEEWKVLASLCCTLYVVWCSTISSTKSFLLQLIFCDATENRFFWGRRKCGNSWRIFPFPLLRKKEPPSIGVGFPRLNGKLVAFFLLVFSFFWSFFLAGWCRIKPHTVFFHAKGVNAWKRHYAYFCISFLAKMLFPGGYSSLWHCKNSFVFQPFLEEVVPHQSQKRQNNAEKWAFFCIIFAKMVRGKAVPLVTTPPLSSWEIIFCSNVENQLVCFMKLFLEEIAAH